MMVMKVHEEAIKFEIEGTIIDTETTGPFHGGFKDSRQFARIKLWTFGFLNSDGLKIVCAKKKKSLPKLVGEVRKILSKLEKPFYAFNAPFEMGVLFHNLDQEVIFESELNAMKMEKKENVVEAFGVPQYGDPFKGDGKECMEALLDGRINEAVAHNRACLLKERDILMRRGFRKVGSFEFVSVLGG